MKWGAVGRRRLLKLAEHLESGTLGHAKFNFGSLNEGERAKKGCGAEGCGLGEMPIVFPKQWCFDHNGEVVLKTGSTGDAFGDARQFFRITNHESIRLFISGMLCEWASSILYADATRYQVAKSIRQFIPWKDEQESQLKSKSFSL